VSEHGAYLIDLSARDLARLGLVMARGGLWADRTVIPSAWVDQSTRAVSVTPGGWHGYGLMWWVPRRAYPFWRRNDGDAFFAWGNFGQFLFVDRARDLVIVHRTDGPALLRQRIDDGRIAEWLRRVLAAMPERGHGERR
jgi:CubicO group peptidase (beta-lactamase class C family)